MNVEDTPTERLLTVSIHSHNLLVIHTAANILVFESYCIIIFDFNEYNLRRVANDLDAFNPGNCIQPYVIR